MTGLYAFWKDAGDARVVEVDMRETQVDVSGQEMLTADKVTLCINAMVTYVGKDARRTVRLFIRHISLEHSSGFRRGFVRVPDRPDARWSKPIGT
jgi:regulator of protease activity HflC (stomatin/prohibitin superfamily)